MLLQILMFVPGILIALTIHELGHYFAARLVGAWTPVFSIGIGNKYWVFARTRHTEFRFKPLIAGGFCYVVLDPTQELLAEVENATGRTAPNGLKPLADWQLAFIYAGGVIANAIFALVMFYAVLLVDGSDAFNALGGAFALLGQGLMDCLSPLLATQPVLLNNPLFAAGWSNLLGCLAGINLFLVAFNLLPRTGYDGAHLFRIAAKKIALSDSQAGKCQSIALFLILGLAMVNGIAAIVLH